MVNSLGWKSLRELQEQAIEPILDGQDSLVVGPTAGGKTEAACLPLLSRIAVEDWNGLSALYVSPLRALANDIETRLSELFGLMGRRVEAWHGDVGPSKRKAILREPPDVLVTTPESLEVMLVSTRVEHQRLFKELRCIVIDEIHSFGSDDRGWHLLAVLARIERLIGRRLQRVGLSATVGNPSELLSWMQMSRDEPKPANGVVVQPRAGGRRDAELRADFVGSLLGAAKVTAALHRGEKRLVFCDSRRNVERIAATLRQEGVDTYVSHSSLSRDERRQAEKAFAEGSNCVIVATSTLELGIDVGDLDRVIQIDAPSSVASFLQRMGRTGRRAGTHPNMLFLSTTPEYLLRALGLTLLWKRQFVEDVTAPPHPLHLVGQQLLALCLQEGQLGSNNWQEWIERAHLADPKEIEGIVQHMLAKGLVEEDNGLLFIGERSEKVYGRKNFMELLSVFTTPPLIEVRQGRESLGSVHESTFYARKEQQQPVLLLAGRSWALEEINWKRRLAYVVPAPERGDSRWRGSGQPLSFELCRAMRDVLSGEEAPLVLSRRANGALNELQDRFRWVDSNQTTIVSEAGRLRWWTFAGTLANQELAWRLGRVGATSSAEDEFSVPLQPHTTPEQVREALATPPSTLRPVAQATIDELKFKDCLTAEAAANALRRRAEDPRAVEQVHAERIGSLH